LPGEEIAEGLRITTHGFGRLLRRVVGLGGTKNQVLAEEGVV